MLGHFRDGQHGAISNVSGDARRAVGDDAFFRTLQQWVSRNHGQSRTTSDFIALVSSESGRDLTSFFDTWLYASVVPTAYP